MMSDNIILFWFVLMCAVFPIALVNLNTAYKEPGWTSTNIQLVMCWLVIAAIVLLGKALLK